MCYAHLYQNHNYSFRLKPFKATKPMEYLQGFEVECLERASAFRTRKNRTHFCLFWCSYSIRDQ